MRRVLPLFLLVPAAFAQSGIKLQDNQATKMECSARNFCEMREERVAGTASFVVEDLHNGEVTVRGWTGRDVKVRFRVEVETNSEREAKDTMGRIHTRLSPGRVSVDGPEYGSSLFGWISEPRWRVSAEVFVPQTNTVRVGSHNGAVYVSDLSGRVEARSHNGKVEVERVTADVRATSHNGEVRLTDIAGDVDYETHNGASNLSRVHGSVRGVSHNGGTEVELAGASSAARRVDVMNHNGAVTIAMPKNFSAHVRSESRGQLRSDFAAPAPVRNRDNGVRDFNIGSGQASVRVRTNNGAVRLRAI